MKVVEAHLNRIRSSCIEEVLVLQFLLLKEIINPFLQIKFDLFCSMQTNDPVMEAPEANFMKLVQGLIEDNDGREHFLKVKLILFLI